MELFVIVVINVVVHMRLHHTQKNSILTSDHMCCSIIGLQHDQSIITNDNAWAFMPVKTF